MNTATTIKIPEYAQRFIREKIAEYRREHKYLGALTVLLPVEAETSINYLQAHYQENVIFQLSYDLRFGELSIGRVDAQEKSGAQKE